MRTRIGIATMAAAACVALLGAQSASATTVTIGSPLPGSLAPTPFVGTQTVTTTSLSEPGAIVSAPANGTITSWRVVGAQGGPLTLRVVRPVGGGKFTGGGKVNSGPITGLGVLTFPTTLPIKQGDLIGLDPTAPTDTIGASPAGGTYMYFSSPLVDSGPGTTPTNPAATGEVGFNAQVLLNCIVPKLKGKKVKAAKKALAKAGCAPPKLKKKGKFVKSQNPAPGQEIPSDRAVVLKRRPAKS